ncbi:uncharacterized protein LOC141908896 isoform X2 [Tubulanus polymorphus]|uniref:uncharacterized protein LOC141908896 isoform X2 n=1 Tax=Tubulanus polymorphus TaxID=672921 RepID=UPI003DA600BC
MENDGKRLMILTGNKETSGFSADDLNVIFGLSGVLILVIASVIWCCCIYKHCPCCKPQDESQVNINITNNNTQNTVIVTSPPPYSETVSDPGTLPPNYSDLSFMQPPGTPPPPPRTPPPSYTNLAFDQDEATGIAFNASRHRESDVSGDYSGIFIRQIRRSLRSVSSLQRQRQRQQQQQLTPNTTPNISVRGSSSRGSSGRNTALTRASVSPSGRRTQPLNEDPIPPNDNNNIRQISAGTSVALNDDSRPTDIDRDDVDKPSDNIEIIINTAPRQDQNIVVTPETILYM